jgi:hypothetical protein
MQFRILRLGYVHRKNLEGFRLLAGAAGARLEEIEDMRVAAETPCDLLWIPVGAVHPAYFPKARRIVNGPHNFVTPGYPWTELDWSEFAGEKRVVYNCLGDWNKKWCAANGGAAGLPLVSWPFPVDTQRFCPGGSKEKVFDCLLYWKHRRPEELEIVRSLCRFLGLRFTEISYGSYDEDDYIRKLRASRFVVWIGGHESQGFALQECLACGLPVLVWDVTSMGQEWNREESVLVYGGRLESHAAATSVPWWDARCGVKVTNEKDLLRGLFHMACAWDTFHPREFVEETLSAAACLRVWISDSCASSGTSGSGSARLTGQEASSGLPSQGDDKTYATIIGSQQTL